MKPPRRQFLHLAARAAAPALGGAAAWPLTAGAQQGDRVPVTQGREPLTFTDKLLLDKAADLLMGQPKAHVDRTRSLNTVARIVEIIRRKQPKPKQRPPRAALTEYISAKYGAVA
jgi:hypothetical protein